MGPMPPRCVVRHEVLEKSPIVEQFLGAELFDQLVDNRGIVTLVAQLMAQLCRCVIAARQGIERRRPSRTRIERLYLATASDATTSLSPRFMVAFSGISLARICPSMSFATSGCCCRKSRALSLPCPIRSPL
jgi:hypothetical protein